eukprot:sb/3468698/
MATGVVTMGTVLEKNWSNYESLVDTWTLAYWIRQDNMDNASYQYPFTFTSQVGIIDDVSIELYGDILATWLQFHGIGNGDYYCKITMPEVGTWSHVTISYDRSTTSLKVFVNGTQQCLNSNTPSGSTNIDNGLFVLGQEIDAYNRHYGDKAMFDKDQAFVGAIHGLNWYKVAITSEGEAKSLQLGKLNSFPTILTWDEILTATLHGATRMERFFYESFECNYAEIAHELLSLNIVGALRSRTCKSRAPPEI